MSDDRPDVGSLHEETARLLGALGEWAQAGQAADEAGPDAEPLAGDCRYCPVCQVIHVVRGTNPEVREHLATAATALLQVASQLTAELMATHVPRSHGAPGSPGSAGTNGAGVERIDLDDDDAGPIP